MVITAKQIAEGVQGEIIGDESAEINNIAKIEEGKPNTISFLAVDKYLPYLDTTDSGVVLISRNLVPSKKVKPTLIVVDDAYKSFVNLLELYNQMSKPTAGIHPQSFVEKSAQIDKDSFIGAFAYIGENVKAGKNLVVKANCYIGNNVQIGENVTIEPNVVIYDHCEIGNNVVIHAGSVIGSDGFGFVPEQDGYHKVPQLGNVIIEDNVEIGSNCSIDRATMGSTIIKKGAKLDNLIQIAHNVQIGSHTVIAAQAGIAGSTKIGEWTMIGGQVGIAGHIKIGNKVRIQAQSGVGKNTPDGTDWYGSPAFDANEYRKSYVYFKNFQKLVDRIEKLEKELKNVKPDADNG